MKTLILSLLTLSAASFATEKEVSLNEIGHALSQLNDATSFIVKVAPGDELPLNFRMSGDVLGLENPPENGKIKALQPLYVKVEPSFLFSTDKKEWKSFESFFTGQLGVSVGSNELSTGEIYLDLQKR
ncbi:MAG: hypothetical protein KFB93_04965 [Simkaniaceae bacterium]|nr:MAG: hypothetical protein KFB93_04965 [Simkaniaceae bacterium]